jgi:hypothetical protein
MGHMRRQTSIVNECAATLVRGGPELSVGQVESLPRALVGAGVGEPRLSLGQTRSVRSMWSAVTFVNACECRPDLRVTRR